MELLHKPDQSLISVQIFSSEELPSRTLSLLCLLLCSFLELRCVCQLMCVSSSHSLTSATVELMWKSAMCRHAHRNSKIEHSKNFDRKKRVFSGRSLRPMKDLGNRTWVLSPVWISIACSGLSEVCFIFQLTDRALASAHVPEKSASQIFWLARQYFLKSIYQSMECFTIRKMRLDSRLSNEMTKIPTIHNHNKQVNLTHRPRQFSKKKKSV